MHFWEIAVWTIIELFGVWLLVAGIKSSSTRGSMRWLLGIVGGLLIAFPLVPLLDLVTGAVA